MKYQDQLATQFDKYSGNSPTDERGLDYLLTISGDVANKWVLDYGCGSGRFSKKLSDHGAKVFGVDPSKELIDLTGQLSGSFAVGDYTDLEDKEQYDLIYLNFVLPVIEDQAEVEKIIKKMFAILKSEGCMYLLHTNWDKSAGIEFDSFRLPEVQDLELNKRLSLYLKKEPEEDMLITEWFRPKNWYFQFLTSLGFDVSFKNVFEDEEFPPFYIIKAKK